MKLLFDENLSPRLVDSLATLFPDSAHVHSVGLGRKSDEDVWTHARTHGFAIVSKDADFHQRSLVFGPPPKLVWIRRGNCSTEVVEDILRRAHSDIEDFGRDDAAFLILE